MIKFDGKKREKYICIFFIILMVVNYVHEIKSSLLQFMRKKVHCTPSLCEIVLGLAWKEITEKFYRVFSTINKLAEWNNKYKTDNFCKLIRALIVCDQSIFI